MWARASRSCRLGKEFQRIILSRKLDRHYFDSLNLALPLSSVSTLHERGRSRLHFVRRGRWVVTQPVTNEHTRPSFAWARVVFHQAALGQGESSLVKTESQEMKLTGLLETVSFSEAWGRLMENRSFTSTSVTNEHPRPSRAWTGHPHGTRLQWREFVLAFFCFFLFGGEATFQESSGQVLTSQAKCDRQP